MPPSEIVIRRVETMSYDSHCDILVKTLSVSVLVCRKIVIDNDNRRQSYDIVRTMDGSMAHIVDFQP